MASAGRVVRDVAGLEVRARPGGEADRHLRARGGHPVGERGLEAAFAEELTHAVVRLAAKSHVERAPGGRRFRLFAAVHPAAARSAGKRAGSGGGRVRG